MAGLLAVGVAAVIAGSRSFAAIGQWAADAGPEAQAGGPLVIAVDSKTVRSAKGKNGKAPHLVAALAHGIGAVLGQVAVDEKSNEIPAVRELLKAFANLSGVVLTIDAMHTQHDTAQLILGTGADYMAGSGSRRAFDAYVLGGASEPSPTSFDCRTTSDPSARVTLCDAQSTGDLLNDVENIPGAIGYAQTGDVTTAPPGTLQSVALNGLSGSFGNIGRAKNNYQYWTTEYIYTNGRASGLAAAFIGYLSNVVALNDLADAGYTTCRDPDHPSAARLCALPGS